MAVVTLGEKQRLFTHRVGQLILWSYANGYELTFGDAYRTPEQAAANAASGKGIARSNHTVRLAVDLNLFIGGEYQRVSGAYTPLGEFWKSLGEECCWGGDFRRPDGNHFSFEHNGVR